jgi:hypothetical protein
MTPVKKLRVAAIALFALWLVVEPRAAALPASLSDAEFWSMIENFSEAGGSFASDNIISNEIAFQQVIPELRRAQFQDAYIGVGPEQNFTYITALKPRIAFIVDIRRQNLLLHLTYKALVEMSADRADFLSRLFARPRPAGVNGNRTAHGLFEAFAAVPLSDELVDSTLRAIVDHLEDAHKFPLSAEDKRGIEQTYRTLYLGGPKLRGDFGGGSWIPSYAELMSQTDLAGVNHSYLASEENFQLLKEYEQNNLIVPLVGDFSGDGAIRAVGRYLKERGGTVTTFYTSNVEEYLFRAGTWGKFARNVSVLPIGGRSMFIRTYFTHTDAGLRTLLDSMQGLLNAVTSGDIRTYNDVILQSKSPTP